MLLIWVAIVILATVLVVCRLSLLSRLLMFILFLQLFNGFNGRSSWIDADANTETLQICQRNYYQIRFASTRTLGNWTFTLSNICFVDRRYDPSQTGVRPRCLCLLYRDNHAEYCPVTLSVDQFDALSSWMEKYCKLSHPDDPLAFAPPSQPAAAEEGNESLPAPLPSLEGVLVDGVKEEEGVPAEEPTIPSADSASHEPSPPHPVDGVCFGSVVLPPFLLPDQIDMSERENEGEKG